MIFNVGDIIEFGNCYQSNELKKEPIWWKVLDVKDDKVLIISEKALDCKEYNTEQTDITWETCSLRKWLNDGFLNAAFNLTEQKMIKTTKVTADKNLKHSTDPGKDTTDRIFLLSITEAEKYFSSNEDRMCVPEEYVLSDISIDYIKNGEATCWWWLRSPGNIGYFAALIDEDGSISSDGGNVSYEYVCVRPALWLKL